MLRDKVRAVIARSWEGLVVIARGWEGWGAVHISVSSRVGGCHPYAMYLCLLAQFNLFWGGHSLQGLVRMTNYMWTAARLEFSPPRS